MIQKVVAFTYSLILSIDIVISATYFKTLWGQGEDYTAGLNLSYATKKNIIILCILTILIFYVFKKIEIKLERAKITNDNTPCLESNKIYLVSILLNFTSWGLWFMVFAPGAGMNDTLNTLMTRCTVNNCPIVYQGMMWYGMRIFVALTGSMYRGYACLTLVQMLLCSLIFSSVIKWLSDKKIKRTILCVLMLYYSFLPVIADYSITLVKDTLFAAFLLDFVILLYDVMESNGNNLGRRSNTIKLIFVSIAMCCFRSNGAMVCVASLIILCTVIKKQKKKLVIALLAVCIANFGIGYLEQINFEEDVKFRESCGVLMAQIGAVLNDSNASIDPDDIEVLNQILPVEIWKSQYRPSFADTIKFNPNFNNKFLNENKTLFIKTWFHIMTKNLKIYVKAYICHSYGYWGILPYPPDISQSAFTSINNNTGKDSIWGQFCLENGLINHPILPAKLNDALKNIYIKALRLNFIVTPGLMLFMVLGCIAILFAKHRVDVCVPCMPILATWGTMMIASPASLIYRYSYYFVLTVPVVIVMTILKYTEKQHEKV